MPAGRTPPCTLLRKALTSWFACAMLAGCGSLADTAVSDGGGPVTQWTLIADYYGNGQANWRVLAIMQRAMHDALNAAHPVYARWRPPTPDEPPPDGAIPEVAMAAAAHEVLWLMQPARRYQTDRAFASVLAQQPDGPGKQAGIRLGTFIGQAAVQRRKDDGSAATRDFKGSDLPGKWRPTPLEHMTSETDDTRPFLFVSVAEVPVLPPPDLGSPRYNEVVDEVRRIGGDKSTERTKDETDAAKFWAYQTSQRGYLDLGVRLLAEDPPPGGVYAQARIMSQLTAALADSAILIWHEKEHFDVWRPVTAIRAAARGRADWANWLPLVETPPFPEYPSGHASDCFSAGGVLQEAFADWHRPIVYRASNDVSLVPAADYQGGGAEQFSMGQHRQTGTSGEASRTFPNIAAAMEECYQSRIWAGAHFRTGEDEARRMAYVIVQRAIVSVPAIATASPPPIK
jgi:hypothetical protein